MSGPGPAPVYRADLAVPADITGPPAISPPYGSDEHGRPIGVPLIGRCFEDAGRLGLAAALEDRAQA